MSESSRLAAHRSRVAALPEIDEDEHNQPEDCDQPEGKPKKDKTMTETATKEALDAAEAKGKTEGETAGFAKANERMIAVRKSEHYAGREDLATALLGNAALGADDIVAALAAAPKAAPAVTDPEAAQKAADAAAAEEAKKVLAETGNSGVDAGGKPALDAKAKASAVWDRANAKVGRAKPAA